MKKIILFTFLLLFSFCISAQQVSLKKGKIIDEIQVNDSIPETFALYLPTTFDVGKAWPIIFVYDMQGRAKQAIGMLAQAAENEGYILAASNSVNDTLKLTENILISNRMFKAVYDLLPISKGRTYTAGFQEGGRMASLIPTFVKNVNGVLSCGASIANTEVLSVRNKFHFVGLVNNSDYNYPIMLNTKRILDKLKFPNQLIVFDSKRSLPSTIELSKAMNFLTLRAMKDGIISTNSESVETSYKQYVGEVSALVTKGESLRAHQDLLALTTIFKNDNHIDSLRLNAKTLRRTKAYKTKLRRLNNALFKEDFLKDEYAYLVEEDVLTYNYNNLGWWKYQVEELEKYLNSSNVYEKRMGIRLLQYINALIADNLDLVKSNLPLDEEAVTFLWMMKTVTDATNSEPYLQVISNSSRVEDFGTALYYLEELLKIGYTNKDELYALEHAALLRITPEFNDVIRKYWKDARF